jgi:protein-S-isoprenylcysteine O-methyltransferase Ste14
MSKSSQSFVGLIHSLNGRPHWLFVGGSCVLKATGEIMKIRTLTGAGDLIMGATLPFAVVGIILNALYPEMFRTNMGLMGIILGSIFLIVGVPIWLTSVFQILVHVPRGELITTGAFVIVTHPLYSSVAWLVIPGIGFVLDTWIGFVIGIVLYVFARLFSVKEERKLEEAFPTEYRAYRATVVLPWL